MDRLPSVAVISTGNDPCPPNTNGSVDLMSYWQALGLALKGHEVRLFASADSHPLAGTRNLVFHPFLMPSLRPQGIEGEASDRLRREKIMPDALRRIEVLYKQREVDALLVNDLRAMEAIVALGSSLQLPPTVAVAHWDPSGVLNPIFGSWGNRPMVAISQEQQRVAAGVGLSINWIDTLYNGIDNQFFKPRQSGDVRPKWLSKLVKERPVLRNGFLFWGGRMSPSKGPVEAIRIALRLNQPLIMAGKIDRPRRSFYLEQVAPLLARPEVKERVIFLGEVTREKMRDLYQWGELLLNPIRWDEPFGLNVAEAMCCGMPVVATRRGAMSELIEEGTSGHLVDSSNEDDLVDRFAQQVGRVAKLDRRSCVESAQRFSQASMATGYSRMVRELVEREVG